MPEEKKAAVCVRVCPVLGGGQAPLFIYCDKDGHPTVDESGAHRVVILAHSTVVVPIALNENVSRTFARFCYGSLKPRFVFQIDGPIRKIVVSVQDRSKIAPQSAHTGVFRGSVFLVHEGWAFGAQVMPDAIDLVADEVMLRGMAVAA